MSSDQVLTAALAEHRLALDMKGGKLVYNVENRAQTHMYKLCIVPIILYNDTYQNIQDLIRCFYFNSFIQ